MPFEPLQQAPWIDTVEARLGFSLPSSLRVLTMNYAFPAVSIGDVELFANLGDGADDDLTVAPFKDSHLSKWLQTSRRVQFARQLRAVTILSVWSLAASKALPSRSSITKIFCLAARK
jgi:hypothetical protein